MGLSGCLLPHDKLKPAILLYHDVVGQGFLRACLVILLLRVGLTKVTKWGSHGRWVGLG